ncbi:MAG: ABC transporter permease [Leptolyngbya sp. SIO1D8]|nr:ABC transporter permease [Leptolyngbya sp. SIO1D8]
MDLLIGELKRTWIQFIRYPAEVIAGVAITTSVFYGLFLSAQYMAGPSFAFGDRLDAVVVGYVLWTLTLYIINDIAIGLQSEAQTGTLEQVFLSPYGAPRVFLARAFASLVLRLILIMGVVALLMGITGSRLSFPITLVFPLLALVMAGYGLAFAMGACALMFKRVQQVLGVFQFLLLFLLAAPVEEWTGPMEYLRYLLPMLPSTALLRDLMARGLGLDWGDFCLALLNGSAYLGMGLLLFRGAEIVAKRRGSLSGY